MKQCIVGYITAADTWPPYSKDHYLAEAISLPKEGDEKPNPAPCHVAPTILTAPTLSQPGPGRGFSK